MNPINTRELHYSEFKRNNSDEELCVGGINWIKRFCERRVQRKDKPHAVSYIIRDKMLVYHADDDHHYPIKKNCSSGYMQPNQPYIPIHWYQAIKKRYNSFERG